MEERAVPRALLSEYHAMGIEPFAELKTFTGAHIGAGLGLRTRTARVAGSVLWEEAPFAAVLRRSLWQIRCHHCYSEIPGETGLGQGSCCCKQVDHMLAGSARILYCAC